MLGFRGISKRFGGIRALTEVGFDVLPGEIHAVVGANGAGKSTLMKILSGVVEPDAGEIVLDGRPVRIRSPIAAQRLGIGLVPQETTLCENLSVAENIYLGRDAWRRPRELAARAAGRLRELGLEIDPLAPVASLPVGRKQLVQIVRALVDEPRVLALDEPTASLSEGEVERLFKLLFDLKKRGVTLFFVSHRLKEIQALADRATVLRDGRFVATVDAKATPREELVAHMAGREVKVERGTSTSRAEEALGVEGVRGISFTLKRGEILGCFGLVGAGRTELARALFGVDAAEGVVRVDGRRVSIRSPRDAVRCGIALVPEDRKLQGLVLKMRIAPNATLAVLPKLSPGGLIPAAKERALVRGYIEKLGIRCAGPEQAVVELSGGNQQKVVLAKWLDAAPRVLILDEPTKGVDLAAKAEIHAWVRGMAASGVGVLLISSELEEIRALSDRVLVFKAGRVAGEFAGAASTDAALMAAAT